MHPVRPPGRRSTRFASALTAKLRGLPARPDVTIRAARAKDGERLQRIAVEAKTHWGYDRARVEEWASVAFSPGALRGKEIYVGEVDGQVVGWTALLRRGETCWLDDLWVEPEWIGRGIGRRLFGHAANRAVELGARTIEWEAEPYAVGFYEKMGARHVRESAPSEWGRTLPVMSLDLTDPP